MLVPVETALEILDLTVVDTHVRRLCAERGLQPALHTVKFGRVVNVAGLDGPFKGSKALQHLAALFQVLIKQLAGHLPSSVQAGDSYLPDEEDHE